MNGEDWVWGDRNIEQNLGWFSQFKEMLRHEGDTTESNKIPLEIIYLADNDQTSIRQDLTLEDFKKMSTLGSKIFFYIS